MQWQTATTVALHCASAHERTQHTLRIFQTKSHLLAPWSALMSALLLSNRGDASLDVFANAAANKLLLAETPSRAFTSRALGKSHLAGAALSHSTLMPSYRTREFFARTTQAPDEGHDGFQTRMRRLLQPAERNKRRRYRTLATSELNTEITASSVNLVPQVQALQRHENCAWGLDC